MGIPTGEQGLADLREVLLRLELAIAQRRAVDLPGGSYEHVLHAAFRETGAGGREWTRAATVAALEAAPASDLAIERFEVEVIADGVVLATYDTGGVRPARRCSIWVLADGAWRLRYHQGTLR